MMPQVSKDQGPEDIIEVKVDNIQMPPGALP